MKRATKRVLLIGGLLLILGVTVFVIAMSTVDWKFSRLDTETYTQKKFAAQESEQITRVEADIDFPLQIAQGDTVALEYYQTNYNTVSVTCENGVLRVHESRKSSVIHGWFNVGRKKHPYRLTVQAGAELVVKGTNADVKATGIDAAKITVDSTNTDLELSDSRVATLSVDSTNTDLNLLRCEGDTLTVSGTNIDAKLNNCTYQNASLSGTNTDFNTEACTLATLRVSGTNIDADLARLTVHTLTVSGTNLDADILIVGSSDEYSVHCSGEHLEHLPADKTGTTDKSVTLSGTNNDVSLRFTN